MTKHWPWLLLLLIPMVMFPGAIPGDKVVSADDHLSVHHAFQTEAGGRVRHPHLSDPALQFKALREAVRVSVSHGEIPLWNHSIWAGAPLLGDAQSMVGSPVTWIHLMLPADWAQDLAVIWLLLWIGLGSGLLIRHLGAGTWGAVTGAAASMTTPYLSVWMLHPHGATIVWLPWILLTMEKRNTTALAVCTAGMLMGGHPETAFHAGMLVGGWWLLRMRSTQPILGFAAGVLLAGPIVLPFIEEVLRSATLSAHGGNTLAVAQLLDLVWPNWYGHPVNETWNQRGWSWADGRLHPGLGALALAVWSLRSRHAAAHVALLLFVLFVLCSVTGLPGPFNHARMGSIGASLVAIAAGLGVKEKWGPTAFLVVLGTGVWAGWNDQGSVSSSVHDPEPAPWTDRLKEHVASGRVIGLGWALQPNTGALIGVQDLRGYDLPVSKDTERLQMALNPRPIRPWFQLNETPPINLLRLAGVQAVLSTEPVEHPIDLGTAPLFASAIEPSMPPAWKATAPFAVQNPQESVRALISSRPDALPVENLSGDWPSQGHVVSATDFQRTTRTVAYTVSGPQAGLAVLNDAWHPGWTVKVNGQPAEPLRVGGVFRGVRVGSGTNTIVWHFSPWGWRWGCWMFVAGFLTLVVRHARQRWMPHRRRAETVTRPH